MSKEVRERPLSKKENVFIEEYLKTNDYVAAYKIAYPNQKNYNHASKYIKKPRIKNVIDTRRKEIEALENKEFAWTRDDAKKVLKTLLADSYTEIESKKIMKKELITFIEAEIEANPEKLSLQEKLIKAKGMDILKRNIIESITKAVEILNRMSGFNEETINNQFPTIIFRGEEDLLD
jgi:phage terminase small subunit